MTTKTIDLRFTGTLVAQTPISIVPPNNGTLEHNGGTYSPIARHSIFDPATNQVEQRPVITASTLRGKIRRAAARICFALSEGRPGLTPFLYASVGDVKGAGSEDVYSINDRNARRERNPIIALFGASVPWDMSRAYVDHAIGRKEDTEVVSGVRTDDFQRNADILELLDDNSVEPYLEKRENVKAVKALKAQKTELIRKLKPARDKGDTAEIARINADLKALDEQIKAAKKEAGNSLMLPHAHETIVQGAQLTHRIVLNRVTEAEAGLFLLAIRNVFDQSPVFGAKAANNYGLITADWKVEMRLANTPGAKWGPVGHVAMRPFDEGEISGAELEKCLTAWDEYVASGKMNVLVDGVGDTERVANDDGDKPAKKAKASKAAA